MGEGEETAVDMLVSTDWLEEHLEDRGLVVVDATVDIDVVSGTIVSGRHAGRVATFRGRSLLTC